MYFIVSINEVNKMYMTPPCKKQFWLTSNSSLNVIRQIDSRELLVETFWDYLQCCLNHEFTMKSLKGKNCFSMHSFINQSAQV